MAIAQAKTIAQARTLPPGTVHFQTVDACTLAGLGDATFDAAFAGCWCSQVPLDRPLNPITPPRAAPS